MTLEESISSVTEDVFVFPVSSAQQRLWFLDQLTPNQCLYSVPTVLRLIGRLDLTALEQSFNEIVRRHESLRTNVAILHDAGIGQPVQIVALEKTIALPLIDLQNKPNGKTLAQQMIDAEIDRPFDLAKDSLLRLLLLQIGETEFLLLIHLHHIVFDEWSNSVFVRELGTLYTAFSQGLSSPLAQLPIQYADFVAWQQQWLQSEGLIAQLSYWRQQLQNASTLALPFDYFRGETPAATSSGARQQIELSDRLARSLKTLSQQADTTLFMTLLAGFTVLLHRYTNQIDISVGTPIANRHHSELENLIGFFANSLVLRTDLSGDPSVWELLKRVRAVALGAYANQDVPFERIVEAVQPPRSTGNPLFQVVFALQTVAIEPLQLPDLTVSLQAIETKTTRFELELYLWECADDFRSLWGDRWQDSKGLRGFVVYNASRFEASTIDQMLRSLTLILEAMVANPNQSISNLPVLSLDEQAQILTKWNQTQREYPKHQCIHQRFENQVRKTPDRVAVQFGAQQFTYAELNRGSNQLARFLQRLGVGVGSPVGVCLDRSVEAIAALLAVLKAGATYVPLDPSYPIDRLQFMIDDAEISVVITQQRAAQLLGTANVCFDQDWAAIASERDDDLITSATAEAPAYVIYTSGSTGTPKGVSVPHRAVLRLVCNPDYVQLSENDRVAQISNLAFDAATFEIWGALLNGAALVRIDRDAILLPETFTAQLQQKQISVLFLTTALFHQVARELPSAFATVRYLLFGGERSDPALVRAVLDADAPEHLIHVYGPTENTTFTCWYEVEAVDDYAETIPIGRAIANTQIYLLDADLKPVPIGVTGEIYVGGDGLAHGYLNRSDLNCFIQNPFNRSDRLYKTGDLARSRSNGNLEFLGRVDDQIKLRGFRIEPGEIESVLSQHPDVKAAIVHLNHQRLIAHIVPVQNAPSRQALQQFLKSKLPDYMIPSEFFSLDTLPLTLNGKIDRSAILLTSAKIENESPNQPQSSIEHTLAQWWTQLLGIESINANDNFFELGGHSLLATQIISRIRDRFEVELPLRCLFETPTIAALAQQIETIQWATQQRFEDHTLKREEVEF